jgi:pantoate--beta-alanine ligase
MPSNFYSNNHNTTVTVKGLTNGLCGSSRPTHFDGVTTVVSRLFGIIQPDIAVFGEKDFQQLAIIRKMVEDLAIPVQIVGGPLVRDADGLALSSRNRFLSPIQRSRALTLRVSLEAVRSKVQSGVKDVKTLLNIAHSLIDVDEIDYLEIRDPDTLEPLNEITSSARAFVAAKLGNTRLIDNMDVSV